MRTKRKNSVIFAELAMSGVFHAGVNAGLVAMAAHIYPDHDFLFYGERVHIETLRARLPEFRIKGRNWPFFLPVNKFTLLPRDLLSCIYVIGIWIRSRKRDTIFVTHLLPLTHGCVYMLNAVCRRSLFIVLHGQLEAFLPETALRGTKPYYHLHGPFLRRDHRARYIVLGEPVFRHISFVFGERVKTLIIDHPYDYPEMPLSSTPYRLPLRFGQIGTGNRGKGTQNLFRLGELLREEIHSGRIELVLVGCLDPACRSMANPWIKWHSKPLSASDFDREVASLHYSLLLREKEAGRATPSGSFFDSVKYGKPFLALESAFSAHYAGRFTGSGTLFPSVEEMAETIRDLCADLDRNAYARQVKVLRDARLSLSAENTAKTFQEQTER